MLKKVKADKPPPAGGRYAIVASQYNAPYVDSMVRAAQAVLRRARAQNVELIRVPGAYEIPVVAAQLARARRPPPDAILCLGVILRGATTHAQHIGEAVSQALMQIQLQHGVPVIHEVLLLEDHAQARERCLSRKHNRGAEAAHTALAMTQVLRGLHEPRPE